MRSFFCKERSLDICRLVLVLIVRNYYRDVFSYWVLEWEWLTSNLYCIGYDNYVLATSNAREIESSGINFRIGIVHVESEILKCQMLFEKKLKKSLKKIRPKKDYPF